MKWKYETDDQKMDRIQKWHRFFAWRPIKSNGTVYWLTFLERRYTYDRNKTIMWDWHWEYREPTSEFERTMEIDPNQNP